MCEKKELVPLVPVIKNDFQFIAGVLFVVIFNYGLFRLFIYLHDKFEYFQTAFGGLFVIIVPFCIIFASILEIAMLYESYKAYSEKEKNSYE